MCALTKESEIALLTKLVNDLGDDSYTGRLFRQILPHIVRAIRNDMPAAVGLHEYYDLVKSCMQQLVMLREEVTKLEDCRSKAITDLTGIVKAVKAVL